MAERPDFEVVFFDAGETLIHPHPSFAELFADVVTREGHALEPGQVREVQERLAPHLVDIAEDTGVEMPTVSPEGSRAFWGYLYERFLGELGLPRFLVGTLYGVFSSTATYRLFDDALPTLDRLAAAGYRLGLISNFERWLENILIEQEVGQVFDCVVISGVEGIEKPDPQIYRLALERANVPAVAAVHVGDSVRLDVEPAARVGMTPVLLDRVGRYSSSEFPKIASLEELPPLLANL